MSKAKATVVGGGILGLTLAERLQAHDIDVTLCRCPDVHGPSADSQRNHGWKQSGLLYSDSHAPHVFAMHTSGEMLLRHVGIYDRPERGIFAVPNSDKSLVDFLGAARTLGLESEVAPLVPLQAESILREFFQQERHYFVVPDGPLDATEVLERLRSMVIRRGARLCTVDFSSLRLDIDSGKARLLIDGVGLPSDIIILASGAGLISLLETADLQHPLAVFQSSLFVLPNPLVRHAVEFLPPLFVDRETDLTVVRHPGCVVLGARFRRTVTTIRQHRSVSREEQLELLERLPPAVRRHASRGRWTAGYKTEALDPNGLPTVAPWVATPNVFGVKGLYAGAPGKATLAWYTASQLVEQVVRDIGTWDLDSEAHHYAPGPPWVEPIHMHFSDHYKDFNEADRA